MDPSRLEPLLTGALSASAAEAFLDSIIENIPDMIFVKDAKELRFVRFNKAGEDLLGYRREELIGKNDYDFFPKEEADFFVSRDRAVLDSGQLMDIPEESIHTRKNGKRLLHTKKIPIFGTDGAPRFLLGISEDITDRRRAEEAEAALYRSRNLEAIGRLAGGVAHDFSNLITGILGMVTELKEESASPAQRAGLDEIARASERAAALTRQLLAFGRRQVTSPRVLDMNIVACELEPLLRRLIGADIELRFELSPTTGCCKIDPGQLEQIILNLALNARDAMPKGGKLTIATSREVLEAGRSGGPDLGPGPYAVLSVADNGTGMDDETRVHAFEPFFSTKPKDKGTGLGLATVHGIVKQNGGDVRLETAPSAGTRVTLWLPEAEGAAEAGPLRVEGEGPTGHETVLVAEDEELVRRMVVKTLEKAGYQVLQARDGREGLAVAAASKQPIDLLVTDVIMPGMNGRELAAQLTALRPRLKVLFISGYTQDVIAGRDLLRLGVAFLEKAFTADVLRAKVREVLDRPT